LAAFSDMLVALAVRVISFDGATPAAGAIAGGFDEARIIQRKGLQCRDRVLVPTAGHDARARRPNGVQVLQ